MTAGTSQVSITKIGECLSSIAMDVSSALTSLYTNLLKVPSHKGKLSFTVAITEYVVTCDICGRELVLKTIQKLLSENWITDCHISLSMRSDEFLRLTIALPTNRLQISTALQEKLSQPLQMDGHTELQRLIKAK